jgi:hypothetical protein
VEVHSSRLKQAEDRTSEIEDNIIIKRKIEELVAKQLKTYKRNMQKLTKSIKRPNMRIIGFDEGEEVQAKGINNIFSKIITENFPKLEK